MIEHLEATMKHQRERIDELEAWAKKVALSLRRQGLHKDVYESLIEEARSLGLLENNIPDQE